MVFGKKTYLCGFLQVDPTYQVYVTDMDHVWACSPSEGEIREVAASANISDFGPEKLRFLVLLFEALFASPQLNLTFTEKGDALEIYTDISEVLEWTFRLERLLGAAAGKFFSSLCLQGFYNQSFLKHLIVKLEDAIRIQQKYILYLEENYKTVNGSELMEKYKRQHPEDAPFLEEYSHDSFVATCRKEFTPLEDKWAVIEDATKDAQAWHALGKPVKAIASKKGITDYMGVGEISRKRPKLEDSDEVRPKKFKREESFLPSSPTKQHSSSPIKLEGSSPRRRRIGRIGRR